MAKERRTCLLWLRIATTLPAGLHGDDRDGAILPLLLAESDREHVMGSVAASAMSDSVAPL